MGVKVYSFLVEFVDALREQLIEDDERWGDTWLQRTKLGQEHRIVKRINDYYDDWNKDGTPVPWLKVAGLAFIAWIRENHPELFPK